MHPVNQYSVKHDWIKQQAMLLNLKLLYERTHIHVSYLRKARISEKK